MLKFCGWLISVVAAFFIGAGSTNSTTEPADSELQQKIQGHLDVIVDESAGIIDDVAEEVRKNEKVQEAEEFLDDVKEIAQNTADDIEAHFGNKEDAETELAADAQGETTEEPGDNQEAVRKTPAETEAAAETESAAQAETETATEDGAV